MRALFFLGYGRYQFSGLWTVPDRERKPGSIGTPLEGTRMRVVDPDGREVATGEVNLLP